MEIIDLTDRHKELFCKCLLESPSEADEAGAQRSQWVERCLPKGLRAKLAVDEQGAVGGMIQYLPIEHSLVDGIGLFFVPCIWVHGKKQGRSNFQKRGVGTALLEAAEADVRARGAKGMAVWGTWLPFWMRASWFKKHGYRKVDRQGVAVLLWKPFADDARPPRWYPKGRTLPEPVPGKVNVTAFSNGWCMAMNMVLERARRASAEFGDKVAFREIDTSERSSVSKWGFADDLFVDGKEVGGGPPPSYEKIRSIIGKRVARLKA
jgi:GNAT superfamily N-acetyltransferase